MTNWWGPSKQIEGSMYVCLICEHRKQDCKCDWADELGYWREKAKQLQRTLDDANQRGASPEQMSGETHDWHLVGATTASDGYECRRCNAKVEIHPDGVLPPGSCSASVPRLAGQSKGQAFVEHMEGLKLDFILGIRAAAGLDLTEAIFAGAKTTGASKRLSMHDLRHMSLAAKERIMAFALRFQTGCCNCDDGWKYDGKDRNQCTCSCHLKETTR